MYKVFNKKYVDLSKIVGLSTGSIYDTNDIDCLVIDIQLLDKPLVVEHPQANFRNQTVNVKEEVEKELNHILDLINKPVETTNEQPKKDLDILYKDQKNIQYPILYKREYGLEVQLTGMSISLQNDGTFFINDTTGG